MSQDGTKKTHNATQKLYGSSHETQLPKGGGENGRVPEKSKKDEK